MANIGALITSSIYNSIVAKVDLVLGSGDGAQQGYGRTIKSSPVTGNSLITSELFDNLYDDLVKARIHQKGSIDWDTPSDGINAPDTGEFIGAFAADIGPSGTSIDANEDQAEGFLDFEQAAQDIVDDQYEVSPGQTSINIIDTSTRTSRWNGSIFHVLDVVFVNGDERRYFFNSGGYIQFDASLTGGTSVPGDVTATPPGTKDEIWQTMLNTMGSIRFSRTSTSNTGSGSSSTIGNYDLTSSYQTIFTKTGSGVYSENRYFIEARSASSNKIQFRISFNDFDLGDDTAPSLGFPGQGIPVDEDVTGTVTSEVTVRTATGLGIEHPVAVTLTNL